MDIDLSIIVPALEEDENLVQLLPALRTQLQHLGISYEFLVVTAGPAGVRAMQSPSGDTRVLVQGAAGYGDAVQTGFHHSRGPYILTMDADLSHPPEFIVDLWAHRRAADIIVASRYAEGGRATMPWHRYILSRTLNAVFNRGLSLSVHDMSSGFRLYRANTVKGQAFAARNFDILQEILVRAHAEGWSVREVPFHYQPRRLGQSHARVVRFGIDYLRTFWKLWILRNSILAADYDDRAHDSIVLPQRFWQRSRFRHIVQLVASQGPVLDVGCGSSRIIGALRPDSVALDVLYRKVRYSRRFARPLVNGSAFQLPFSDGSFSCVLCSQVIEHVPKASPILEELHRVLMPGGRLVLGTPDYAHWQWRWTERLYSTLAPGGYADEHIAHYTRDELVSYFGDRGYTLEETRYILQGEMILAFRRGLS